MKASENFAKRLLKKHNLTIPFDIEKLVREYVDLEFKQFPNEVNGFDAVTLNLKKTDKKPKVYINIKISSRRKNFTLAHELGHIIIPWHTGNIVDSYSQQSVENTNYDMGTSKNSCLTSLKLKFS